MERRILSKALPALIIGASAGGSFSATAATIRVPLDQPTIQAGINVAVNGDKVIVAPGTYTGGIDFLGKRIAVIGEAGREQTIIDGAANGSVVTFASGETADSILRGFTIRNGHSIRGVNGGGVRIANASPTVVKNIVERNMACTGGQGVQIASGAPVIRNNIIRDNTQENCGAGIGGGIGIVGSSSALIEDNLIDHNSTYFGGGGISLYGGGSPTIRSNVISNNQAPNTGGGI